MISSKPAQMATHAAGNGATPPAASALPALPPARPRDARQSRMAHAFSQVVAVLMRDRNYRKMPLAELEWLVLPPLMAGQFRLGQASAPQDGEVPRQNGILVPVAVALWARVSPEIDAALSANLDTPFRLRADQWVAGDRVWLMALAGDFRSLPAFLGPLQQNVFKDEVVKLRAVGADGKAVVTTLGELVKR